MSCDYVQKRQVFIKSNTSDPHRRTGAGEQVKGQDGLDLYVNLELMIFTKDTPEKQVNSPVLASDIWPIICVLNRLLIAVE